MSSPRDPWIDRWWPLLLIVFALTFTLILATFRPQGEWSGLRTAPAVHTAAVNQTPLQLRQIERN